jgi:ELWxxDGT repeat protein
MKKFLPQLTALLLFLSLATKAQTVPLPFNSGFDEDPKSFVNLNGLTYFIAYNNATGYELWQTNGTVSGTVLTVDINTNAIPNNHSLYGSSLTVFKDTLYFFANDGTHGFELWKSDGTAGGTAMVKDIYPGPNGSSTAYGITASANALYFFARDSAGANRYGIWTSDGTAAGTTMLKVATSTNSVIFADSNLVYFDANLGGNGDELCVSDGTVGGTVTLKDINPGTGSSSPKGFIKLGNKIVFTATAANGSELYITDGTGPGTALLKDINIYGNGNATPSAFSKFNGNKVLFYANDSIHGTEPWITDGTSGGTQLLYDVVAGTTGSSVTGFIEFNGKAYFSPGSCWVTDGTSGGTHQFMNAYTSPYTSFTAASGRLYFIARDGNNRQNIWSTTTGADTVKHTANTAPQVSFPILFAGNNVLYVVFKTSLGDKYLHKLDLGICSPAVTIQGNVPLTCDHHSITLSAGSYDNYNWSTGATTPQLNVSAAGTYSVTVQDTGIGCTSSATVNVTQLTTIATPAICGVTVDSLSGKNQIIWNKHNAAFSKTLFRLERETGINQFTLVADIPYDSLSAYIDSASGPMVNSSRYRLTLLDSCGNVSTPSTVHETVHLSKNIGIGGEVNLIWNAYAGNSYTQVVVQRSVNGGAWADLSVLSGNVVSYSDLTPPAGTLNYQIAVILDSTCTPSRSVFSLYSNRVNLVTTGISETTGTGQMLILPNPVASVLRIQLPETIRTGNLLITDLTGRTIRTLPVTSLQLTEDVTELAGGVYIIRHSSQAVKAQYFVKQ